MNTLGGTEVKDGSRVAIHNAMARPYVSQWVLRAESSSSSLRQCWPAVVHSDHWMSLDCGLRGKNFMRLQVVISCMILSTVISCAGIRMGCQLQPIRTINNQPQAGASYIRAGLRGGCWWELLLSGRALGTESQRPWVRLLAAPPFFPALSPFQRSSDSNGMIT